MSHNLQAFLLNHHQGQAGCNMGKWESVQVILLQKSILKNTQSIESIN